LFIIADLKFNFIKTRTSGGSDELYIDFDRSIVAEQQIIRRYI
jgi:hypothetical protein